MRYAVNIAIFDTMYRAITSPSLVWKFTMFLPLSHLNIFLEKCKIPPKFTPDLVILTAESGRLIGEWVKQLQSQFSKPFYSTS